MSTEKLEYYLKLYSQLMEELVVLHNAHMFYLKYFGRDAGSDLRKHYKKVAKLTKELIKTSIATFDEHRDNNKEYYARLREVRVYSKSKPVVPNRIKNKIKNDVDVSKPTDSGTS